MFAHIVALAQAFISLEKEIEDALPQFQELMLSLRSVTLSSSHIPAIDFSSAIMSDRHLRHLRPVNGF